MGMPVVLDTDTVGAALGRSSSGEGLLWGTGNRRWSGLGRTTAILAYYGVWERHTWYWYLRSRRPLVGFPQRT